jgi:membrane protein
VISVVGRGYLAGMTASDTPQRGAVDQPGLGQLRPRTWLGVLVRSLKGFKQDDCADLAAGLTYYALLSVFPAAIVVIALVGLVASSETAISSIMDVVRDLAPAGGADALEDRLREVVGGRTAARFLISFGLLGAIWSASGYVRSYTRAANAIYGVTEGRRAWRLIPVQVAITVVALVLVAVVVVGLVVSGPVARAIGDAIGAGEGAVTVWGIAKWPVLVLVAGLVLSLLSWVAPNITPPRFRWFTVGGAVTLLVWAAVSVGFGFYVANFGNYNATYGALGAVIVFLIWIYLGNCAILLGVEINAELQRGRRLQAGVPLEPDEPSLPPRVAAD